MRNKLLLMLLVVLLLVPFSAYAQEEFPPIDEPNSAMLSPSGSLNNLTPNQIVSNPWGCFGSTQNPHHSSHVPGTINVTARTQCNVAVPLIYVETILQREDCFIFCWWANVGPVGMQSRPGNSVQANSATGCVSGKYRGISFHHVRGADGNDYVATTIGNEVNLTC